jgi:3',5'-cyclic AMP phosphodiesterase CpdA
LIRLLHISDIHFKTPDCLNERLDRDTRVRDLIVRDANEFVKRTGVPVNAILVTGDIAFKASSEEFSTASLWLQKLAKEVGADVQDVYVVPGNHDLNRHIGNKFSVKAVRNEILKNKGEVRIGAFLAALSDQDASNSLMEPFCSYNEFSAQYGCSISPDKPCWQHSIPFCPRYKLTLNGLTSTFFSGSNDQKSNLYMGAFQANLNINDGEVNLAMFHHPYDWMEDGDEIEDFLSNRSQITLVGHKHRQRVKQSERGVLFSAAATNPERNEQNYEPGYNIIDLSISESSGIAKLLVEGHLRVLQGTPEIFVPKMKTTTQNVWKYSFEIPASKLNIEHQEEGSVHDPQTEVATSSPIQESNKRKLVFRFWNIAESARRDIIEQLNLLNEKENLLPRLDKYAQALANVSKLGIKDKFIELLEAAEGIK